MTEHDHVKFHTPNADEAGCVYEVLEMRGDRCLIGIVSINGKAWEGPLGSTQVNSVADLVVVAK